MESSLEEATQKTNSSSTPATNVHKVQANFGKYQQESYNEFNYWTPTASHIEMELTIGQDGDIIENYPEKEVEKPEVNKDDRKDQEVIKE